MHFILTLLLIIFMVVVIDRLSPGLLTNLTRSTLSVIGSVVKWAVIVGIVAGGVGYVYQVQADKEAIQQREVYRQEQAALELKMKIEQAEAEKQRAIADAADAKNKELEIAFQQREEMKKVKIQLAEDEITKTIGYNVTFSYQLDRARALNDVEAIAKIQANMEQNRRWIQKQRELINDIKVGVTGYTPGVPR
jgi:hypothetical protein